MSSSSSTSSSEDEVYHTQMHMRSKELLDMAIRREARLFRRKDLDLRRVVLLDGLIGRLVQHRKQCKKARMSRKRRAVEKSEVVPQKMAKLEAKGSESSEEKSMDLKDRCKMLDVLAMIGARQG